MNESKRFLFFSIYSLKDLLFYEVNENMATPSWFGKNKGCDFLESDCINKRDYEEFPAENTEGIIFNYEGWGKAKSDDGLDGCAIFRKLDLCSEIKSASNITKPDRIDLVMDYGWDSKAF